MTILPMPNVAASVIRVLVVEDREDDFQFLSHLFQRMRSLRAELEWAPSYAQGLEALRRGNFDIALFDYSLGAETGVDLLRAAQALGCTLPILLLTGSENPEIDEAAWRAGAVDFFSKGSVDPVHLERAVRYALRQAEMRSTLRRNQQELEMFLQSLPVIAGRVDGAGRVTAARGRGLDHAGMRPEDLLGHDFLQSYPQSADAVRLALAGESASFNLSGRKADESEWHAEFFVSFDAAQGEGATFVGRDVSARRWLERRLLTVSDAEQQRIGADLHDGLGQQLTGLSCLAAALRDRLKTRLPDEADKAEMIARLANDAIAQSRALARGLCPVQIENAGLVVALEEMAGQAKTLHGVECSFELRGEPPACDHLAALHLYRIVQEAITNAVRHGKARTVQVTLSSEGNQHRLVIVDDGCGFDPAAHPRSAGGGLRLMGYRAAMIGGVFSADSQPGRGTRITCHFSTFPSHENERPGQEPESETCEIAC